MILTDAVSPSPTPVPSDHPKRSWRILRIVFFGLALCLIISFSLYTLARFPKRQVSPRLATISPAPTAAVDDRVLVPYIPNFDHMQISDLPNFSDVRSVYSFQSHQIITGVNRIVEYDPATKKVIRVHNPEKLPSVHYAAMIGTNLYVVSAAGLEKGKSWPEIYPKIIVIDLVSGKEIKHYFGDPARDKHYLNLSATSKGTDLWLSSQEGIMKIDTKTDDITDYATTDLHLPDRSCPMSIQNRQGDITVLVNCNSLLGRAVLDEKTNTWSYFPDNIARYINRSLSDEGITGLPFYYQLSNLTHDTHYLLADTGLYKLPRNAFPEFLHTVNIQHIQGMEDQRKKFYITQNERYGLLVGPQTCGPVPATRCSPFAANLIDLQTYQNQDLLANNQEYEAVSPEQYSALEIKMTTITFEESKDQITISVGNGPDRETLAVLDVNSHTLHFPIATKNKE